MIAHGIVLMSLLLGAAADIEVVQIAGEGDPGPYRHPASFAELDSGDFLLSYYGGSGEYGTDTAVYAKRLKKGDTEWSKAFTVADTPWIADGNSVVWQYPGGDVWLFYVNRYGETWSDSVIMGRFSKDNANTWSDAFIVSSERGSMVRGKPIMLEGGRFMLPIYHETGHDPEFVGADTASAFFIFDPEKHTWTETNRITSRMGNLQPAPAIVDGDYLVAYMRRGGGYEPIKDGYIVRSESHDGGKTWSEGKETAFPNPNAAVDLVRLKNGHLLLVYNDSMSDRNPLTVAISTDGDKSYPHKRNIMEGDEDFAYPYAVQTKDGKIRVIFTSHGRTTVHMATFDESAILDYKAPAAAGK